MTKGTSFQLRLTLWLLAVQGVIWAAIVPWNFLTTVHSVGQLQGSELSDRVRDSWEAARSLQAESPVVRTLNGWDRLTVAMEGVLREDQARRAQQTDVVVQGFRGLVLSALLQLVGLVLTAFLAARVLSRQVRVVNMALVRLREGDTRTRLPSLAGKEFGVLGQEFNRLLDALESKEQQLSELGKLIGWQETARFLSHQIKNPLTAIGLATKNLKDLGALESSLARQNAEILTEESDKLLHLVNRLKELTGFGELKSEPIDVATLAQEVAARAFPVPFELTWVGPKPLTIHADKMLLEQVFLNLFVNSAEASEGPPVQAQLSVVNQGLIYVDSHTGLDAELPSKLFRPPFTTKSTGTGLGLSFCRRIMQLHGGSLTADLTEARGLRFHLTFGEASHA